ncbi:MAG: radical SAM family heme chaperone HemW [Elusimicrobiota bacterium]|jgi:oxygen-independent coproporphyrinogen-3 oxidase|nr:radical SAM family heme chaperone HemW [Elusimicrobiota bacterium]
MTGLYIHIPFCRQKCFYCDFFSVRYDEDLAKNYVDALLIWLENFRGEKIETVYIGGGTPSVLDISQIEKLLSSISKNFDLSNIKEWTIEANPESLSLAKLKIFKDFAVDRLSLGLQSANDAHLKKLGRVHSFDDFRKVFENALSIGFKKINIDLIYGFEGQTFLDFQESLNILAEFRSPHLSLYPLSISPRTPFYNEGLKTDDDLQADFYEFACKFLADNGYIHYEISNWAMVGMEALHNTNYWRNCEYIGAGAGASGYWKRHRYKIVADIGEFIGQVRRGGNIFSSKEFIDDTLFRREKIMLGLRLLNEGVGIENFPFEQKSILNKFLCDGLLINDRGKIKLSQKSVFLSNAIICEFL